MNGFNSPGSIVAFSVQLSSRMRKMSDDHKSKADLIEELNRLRRHLKLSEMSGAENLSTVIRDSVDGILVVDPQGVVLFANPAAQRILGRPSGEILGANLGVPTLDGDCTEMDMFAAWGAFGVGGSPVKQNALGGPSGHLCRIKGFDRTAERRSGPAGERGEIPCAIRNHGPGGGIL